MKKKAGILAVILIVGILVFLIWTLKTSKKFEIPKNYNLKLEDNKSYLDGPDTAYYIYDNKIIVETKFYYPVGHPKGTTQHTITVYNDVNTNNVQEINDVYNIINSKNGHKVYDVYN